MARTDAAVPALRSGIRRGRICEPERSGAPQECRGAGPDPSRPTRVSDQGKATHAFERCPSQGLEGCAGFGLSTRSGGLRFFPKVRSSRIRRRVRPRAAGQPSENPERFTAPTRASRRVVVPDPKPLFAPRTSPTGRRGRASCTWRQPRPNGAPSLAMSALRLSVTLAADAFTESCALCVIRSLYRMMRVAGPNAAAGGRSGRLMGALGAQAWRPTGTYHPSSDR